MQRKTQLFLLVALLIPCWVIAIQYNVDLVNLFAAAGFTHTDLSRVYAYNGNLGRYFYGPFSLVLISPLAHLSFNSVKAFWLVLQTLSYLILWVSLSRLYPVLKEKGFFFSWLIVWIFSINPIHNNFQSNNIQLMLMAVLLIAELKSREESRAAQILSGVLVMMAAAVKVFPIFIAVFYFLVKPKNVKAGIVLGGLLTFALPFVFFGFSNGEMLYREFVTNLGTYSHENNLTKVPDILCLPSLITRLLSPADSIPTKEVESIAKGATVLISALFFLWATLKSLKGEFKDARYSLHAYAMALALMAFLNPSSRPHYFIFYVPAFCSALEGIYLNQNLKRIGWALMGVSIILVAFTTDFFTGKGLNDTLEFKNIPTVGLLLACLTLALVIKNTRTTLRVQN